MAPWVSARVSLGSTYSVLQKTLSQLPLCLEPHLHFLSSLSLTWPHWLCSFTFPGIPSPQDFCPFCSLCLQHLASVLLLPSPSSSSSRCPLRPMLTFTYLKSQSRKKKKKNPSSHPVLSCSVFFYPKVFNTSNMLHDFSMFYPMRMEGPMKTGGFLCFIACYLLFSERL